MKHKYYNEIIAFANGLSIQFRHHESCDWRDIEDPTFSVDLQYRVKPKEQVKRYLFAFKLNCDTRSHITLDYFIDEYDFKKLDWYPGRKNILDFTAIEWCERIDASEKLFNE